MATNGADRVQELIERRNALLPRLHKGRERIRAEEERGGERALPLTLLTDYEQTVDALRTLGVNEADILAEPGTAT